MRVLVIGGAAPSRRSPRRAATTATTYGSLRISVMHRRRHRSGVPGTGGGPGRRCRRRVRSARGIPCFGPTAELARLESSKTFARELATSLGVPGPRFASFDDHDSAITWWRALGRPVVVKLDGLAAGKGVSVPGGDAATIEAIRSTKGPFLLEERLTGPECSLLALCDGVRAVALPLAQDHKRLGEGDTGPNTGGMGLRPGTGPLRRRRPRRRVRATDSRPLRCCRNPIRRRDLRWVDADR